MPPERWGCPRVGTAARPRPRRGRRLEGNRECARGPAGGPARSAPLRPFRPFRKYAGGARLGGFEGRAPAGRRAPRTAGCGEETSPGWPGRVTLKRVLRGRLPQRPGLAAAQRRRLALIVIRFRPFDAADRVMADRVHLAVMVEQGSNGRQLSANRAGRQVIS